MEIIDSVADYLELLKGIFDFDLIKSFLTSLPPRLKDPFANGTVDVSLFTAISSAHLCVSWNCRWDRTYILIPALPLYSMKDTLTSDTLLVYPPARFLPPPVQFWNFSTRPTLRVIILYC